MKTDVDKLIARNENLNHFEMKKVVSHVQRNKDGWWQNTLMLEEYDVPFKYRRKKAYKNLKGARVNITYYPQNENIAGIEFEVMKVVRIRVA